MDINNIIWMFGVGVAIAMAVTYYNARFLGKLVRALIDIDATSPESAITLEEINMKLTPSLKYSLRPGSSFSETVVQTADNRYYIAPDKLAMAKSKYRGKDTTILFLLLSLVILVIIVSAMTELFPMAFSRLQGAFRYISGLGGERL